MSVKKKSKKKQLIKIEGYDTVYKQKPHTISFSLVCRTPEGRKQAMEFTTCRDYLNDALHSRIHEGSCSVYKHGDNPPIDLDKLRLLIGRCFDNDESRNKFKENIFSAKRLLNSYEDAAGWDRSRITTVKHSIIEYNSWLITGPKEWVAYSNLLSIITLIFRIIGNYGPIEFSNNEDAEKWFYDLMTSYEGERRDSAIFQHDSDLSTYLPACWDKLYMIMKHYKEIFTEPMNLIFTPKMSVHSGGGIAQLCLFNTSNISLDNNMRAVYERFKEEKYKTMESDGTVYKLKSEFAEQKKEEDKQNRATYNAKITW